MQLAAGAFPESDLLAGALRLSWEASEFVFFHGLKCHKNHQRCAENGGCDD